MYRLTILIATLLVMLIAYSDEQPRGPAMPFEPEVVETEPRPIAEIPGQTGQTRISSAGVEGWLSELEEVERENQIRDWTAIEAASRLALEASLGGSGQRDRLTLDHRHPLHLPVLPPAPKLGPAEARLTGQPETVLPTIAPDKRCFVYRSEWQLPSNRVISTDRRNTSVETFSRSFKLQEGNRFIGTLAGSRRPFSNRLWREKNSSSLSGLAAKTENCS